MTNLTWERLPNGDRRARQHPILLVKPYSRSREASGWLVKVPFDRDPNYEDGWHWTAVANPTYHERGGIYLEGADYNEARALVAEHLDFVLSQISEGYGNPEPEPAPEPVVEEPLEAVEVILDRPSPAPERTHRVPVTLDYDWRRPVGWVDQWDPETGRLVMEIRDRDAIALLSGRGTELGSDLGVVMGLTIRTNPAGPVPAQEAPR